MQFSVPRIAILWDEAAERRWVLTGQKLWSHFLQISQNPEFTHPTAGECSLLRGEDQQNCRCLLRVLNRAWTPTMSKNRGHRQRKSLESFWLDTASISQLSEVADVLSGAIHADPGRLTQR
jgi:hypothetical protein